MATDDHNTKRSEHGEPERRDDETGKPRGHGQRRARSRAMREQKRRRAAKRRSRQRPVAGDDADHEPERAEGLRAGFAADFPHTPEIDSLLQAFEAGNHWQVRQQSEALLESSEDEAVRQAARDLRQRLEPGRHMAFLLLLPVVLLAILTIYYLFIHGH